ncbi:hypothetical protein SK128_021156 [Halocaridina rubra]|uniref:Endonuclease/exonuclease/phosphatase domain-containing protein n=1 Tax=Halocaridina rubra TaxID=373956 RepID=A0AAN8XCY0_HALRR
MSCYCSTSEKCACCVADHASRSCPNHTPSLPTAATASVSTTDSSPPPTPDISWWKCRWCGMSGVVIKSIPTITEKLDSFAAHLETVITTPVDIPSHGLQWSESSLHLCNVYSAPGRLYTVTPSPPTASGMVYMGDFNAHHLYLGDPSGNVNRSGT